MMQAPNPFDESKEEIEYRRQRRSEFIRRGFLPEWADFLSYSDLSTQNVNEMLAHGCPHEIIVRLGA